MTNIKGNILNIFYFLLLCFLNGIYDIIFENLLSEKIDIGIWQSIGVLILSLLSIYLVQHVIEKINKKKEFKGDLFNINTRFVDRDEERQKILKSLKANRMILLSGDEGIGKTELTKSIVNYLNENKDSGIVTAAFYIEIEEKTKFDDFIRTLYYKLIKTTSKSIDIGILELQELLRESNILIAIDFHCKLQVKPDGSSDYNQILNFICDPSFKNCKLLIVTDEKLHFNHDEIESIHLDQLSPQFLKEIVQNKINELLDIQDLSTQINKPNIDINYLCQHESNTKTLLRATECIVFGQTPEDALTSLHREKYDVFLNRIHNNQLMEDLLSVFLLLDFLPTFDELVLISGNENNELRQALIQLDRTTYFSREIGIDEKVVFRIDDDFKNYVLEKNVLDNICKQSIRDNWISWALNSSSRFTPKNTNEFIYAFQYLSTYHNVLNYCLRNNKYNEIIQLWKNLDYFLCHQEATEIYDNIGRIALLATQKLDDAYNEALLKSEVLGYILVFKNDYTPEIYDEAIDYLLSAELYFRKNSLNQKLANCWRYQGALLIKKYERSNKIEPEELLTKAKSLLINALNLLDAQEHVETICLIYTSLFDVERLSGNYIKAICYQTLKINISKKYDYPDIEIRSYYQLGRLYQSMADKSVDKDRYKLLLLSSLYYYNLILAITVDKKFLLPQVIADSHYRIAEIYKTLKMNTDEAKREINEAIRIAKQLNLSPKKYQELHDKLYESNDDETGKFPNNDRGLEENSPDSIDPKILPLTHLAPCFIGGRIQDLENTPNYMICECNHKKCKVNNKNIIVEPNFQ